MKDVEIYPSSWYYNACVHGFLEVLAWGLGDRGVDIVEGEFLQNDGSVKIPGDLMEAIFSTEDVPAPAGYELRKVPDDVRDLKRIAWWWVEKSLEVYFKDDIEKGKWLNLERANKVIGRLHYKDGIYPNLINLGAIRTAEGRCQELNRLLTNSFYKQLLGSDYRCSFCNREFIAEQEANQYSSALTRSISIIIGSSPDSFPNRMWNGLSNEVFCHQCRAFLLFNHLTFNTNKTYFINTDSLGLNWHLNSLFNNNHMSDSKSFTKVFYNIPFFRQSISTWGLQKIELFSYSESNKKIEHMQINHATALLLIQPRVTSFLNSLPITPVWKLFAKEHYSYFSTLIYKNLSIVVKGKKNEQEKKDIEIFTDVNDVSSVIRLIYLYEAIYTSIKSMKEGINMSLDLQEIKEAAQNAPLDLESNRSLIFRLLELTRLSKKSEVYYLLLRYYTAHKIEFPEVLSNTLIIEDDELFKTGVYAFISYLDKSKTN